MQEGARKGKKGEPENGLADSADSASYRYDNAADLSACCHRGLA